MKKLASLSLAAATLFTAGTAFAQPAAAPVPPPTVYASQPAPEKANSINVDAFGLLFKDLSLTYEHLWSGTHGLILEAGYGQSNGEKGDSSYGLLAVGYRWHWSHRQNSGFLGVTYSQRYGSGYVETQVNDEPVEHHDMTVHSEMLTANIGKRWTLGSEENWNITLRFGLGWGNHTATAKEDTMDAKEAEKEMNEILELVPIGWEGELSVGYNF
jgi:hypothetical protein